MSFSTGAQTKRPHWGPRQVRTLRGLHAGQIYLKVDARTQSSNKIIVLSEPFQDPKRKWKYKFIYWPFKEGELNFLFEGYCADMGIVPDGGFWNQTNSLQRTWHLPLSKERNSFSLQPS